MSKYKFIEAEKVHFSIRIMCRCLQVSTSGFYDWRRRQPDNREVLLRTHIRAIHKRSHGTYGAPRITRALRKMGLVIGHNKVAKVMREEQICGLPRKRPRWKSKEKSVNVSTNLLNQDFSTSAPNRVWVADMTYISTQEGWLYVAVLLDLYSRRVVGFASDFHMKTSLPLRALEQAITLRRPKTGLIHHSDRGSQYTSFAYGAKLSSAGLRLSMSRAGDCLDNAVAESFFGTLKTELIYRHSWKTRAEARHAIHQYIFHFYNSTRQHSANGGLSPNEAEQLFYQSQNTSTA